MNKMEMLKLNSGEILKEIMAEKGYTREKLANELGYSRPSGVTERIRSNRIGLDVFYRMVTAMGCEIVVKSKTFTTKETEDGKKVKVYSEWKIEGDDGK